MLREDAPPEVRPFTSGQSPGIIANTLTFAAPDGRQGAHSRKAEHSSVMFASTCMPVTEPRSGKRRARRKAAAAALVLLLACACLSSCADTGKKAAKTYPVIAVVAQAPDGFDACLAGSDCWLAAYSGMSLLEGDTAWTAPGASLFILFADGTRMALAERSIFRLAVQEGGPRVELSRGEAWLDGTGGQGPPLQTPAAKVVPSPGKTTGWSLGLRVEPGGSTTAIVAAGSAKVENGAGSVTLTAGNKSTCAPGMAPGTPEGAAVQATSLSAPGFGYFVRLQVEPYFRNEATRDKAEDDARATLAAVPNDAWAHLNLGRALLDAGLVSEARSQLDQALILDPQFSQAMAALGRVELLEGTWTEAYDAFSSARRADGRSFEALFGMGQSALGRGDLREAEKWFKETLDLDPEGTMPLVGLGVVELLRQDQPGSRELLKRAAAAEPSSTRAYQVMAIAYSLQGKLDRAEQYFIKALEVDPNDVSARGSLGAVSLRLGRPAAASAAYRGLVDSEDPGRKARGYVSLGAVEELGGGTRAALDYWVKARDLAPDLQASTVDLGQAHLALGEDDAAASEFSMAVAADPAFWYTREWLARAYLAGKDLPRAISESRAAIALNPSAWISHLVLGLALGQTGARAEAWQEAKKGRALKPPGKLSPSERKLLKASE